MALYHLYIVSRLAFLYSIVTSNFQFLLLEDVPIVLMVSLSLWQATEMDDLLFILISHSLMFNFSKSWELYLLFRQYHESTV